MRCAARLRLSRMRLPSYSPLVLPAVSLLAAALLLGGRTPWFHHVAGTLAVLQLGLLLYTVHGVELRIPAGAGFLAVGLFALYVLGSTLNPSYLWTYSPAGEARLVAAEHIRWLPSTPVPERTLAHLSWMLLGLGAAALVATAKLRRKWLRALLAFSVVQATVLALVGFYFRFDGTGRVLGLFDTPSPTFFATLLYRNHWGAYAVLNAFAALGLFTWRRSRVDEPGDASANPRDAAWLWLVAALLLLLSVFAAGSRSAVVAALVGAALWGGLHLRAGGGHKRVLRPAAIGAAVAGALGLYAFLIQPQQIESAGSRTSSDYELLLAEDDINMRLLPYRDTWAMFLDAPVLGWGLGSFRYVWPHYAGPEYLYRRRDGVHVPTMEFAHTDWLQYTAELGLVGLALLLAGGTAGLGHLLQGDLNPVSNAVLSGVGGVFVVAAFEFPLSNPCVFLQFCIMAAAGGRYTLLEHSARVHRPLTRTQPGGFDRTAAAAPIRNRYYLKSNRTPLHKAALFS